MVRPTEQEMTGIEAIVCYSAPRRRVHPIRGATQEVEGRRRKCGPQPSLWFP